MASRPERPDPFDVRPGTLRPHQVHYGRQADQRRIPHGEFDDGRRPRHDRQFHRQEGVVQRPVRESVQDRAERRQSVVRHAGRVAGRQRALSNSRPGRVSSENKEGRQSHEIVAKAVSRPFERLALPGLAGAGIPIAGRFLRNDGGDDRAIQGPQTGLQYVRILGAGDSAFASRLHRTRQSRLRVDPAARPDECGRDPRDLRRVRLSDSAGERLPQVERLSRTGGLHRLERGVERDVRARRPRFDLCAHPDVLSCRDGGSRHDVGQARGG